MWPRSNPRGTKIIAPHTLTVIASQIRIDRRTNDFTISLNLFRWQPGFRRYRNFKVVSAKSAKISARIQNRIMILDSDQPASSKW